MCVARRARQLRPSLTTQKYPRTKREQVRVAKGSHCVKYQLGIHFIVSAFSVAVPREKTIVYARMRSMNDGLIDLAAGYSIAFHDETTFPLQIQPIKIASFLSWNIDLRNFKKK